MGSGAKQSEEQLIRALREGSEQALKVIYEQHYYMIEQMIVANNGTEADAQDIYQEAILVFYQGIRSGKVEMKSKIKTYIYAVSRRLWLKELRNKGRNAELSIGNEREPGVDEIFEAMEMIQQRQQLIQKCLLLLGNPCAELLRCFFYEELNMEKIAERMNYTNAANAKNQKYKCLKRLKGIFYEQKETVIA